MWLLLLTALLQVCAGAPVHNTSLPVHNASLPANENSTNVLEPESFQGVEESVLEGDILTKEDKNAVQSVWVEASVPYTISKSLGDRRQTIMAAFKMISEQTCIRFVERKKEKNHLDLKNGKGCASFVGCQGGAQPLYLGSTCGLGNLVHELLHALGLHHEHTRADRDRHITVHWDRIRPGKERNFRIKEGNTLDLPYDVDSIMHYGKFYFSTGLNPTIVPKKDGSEMGQRTKLSPLDVQRLNKLYHCDKR